MSKLRFNITMSLDGFVAGPNQSVENPLGVGGEALHEWAIPLAAFRQAHGDEGGEVNESTPVMEGMSENVGAGIMGRKMFGAAPAPGATTSGTAGGATTRPSTTPCSS